MSRPSFLSVVPDVVGTIQIPRIPDVELCAKGLGLRALAQKFIACEGPTRSPKTVANHRAALSTVERLAVPDHPTPGDVVCWLANLRAAGYAEGTVALHRWCVEAWYHWGASCGFTYGNPVKLAKYRPPPPSPRGIKGIRAEWPRILAHCAQDSRQAAFLSCFRWLGLRAGEALALAPVDFCAGKCSVTKQRKPEQFEVQRRPKQGSARRLPVPAELGELLDRIRFRPSPLVKRGHGGCAGSVRTEFLFPYRASDLAELRGRLAECHEAFREENEFLHVFRHSRAIELMEAGNDLFYVQRFLGHSNPRTTMRYIASLLGPEVEAAKEFAEDVRDLMTGAALEKPQDVPEPVEPEPVKKGGARAKKRKV